EPELPIVQVLTQLPCQYPSDLAALCWYLQTKQCGYLTEQHVDTFGREHVVHKVAIEMLKQLYRCEGEGRIIPVTTNAGLFTRTTEQRHHKGIAPIPIFRQF